MDGRFGFTFRHPSSPNCYGITWTCGWDRRVEELKQQLKKKKKEEQSIQRCHSWFQSWPIWSATEHGAISAFHAAFPALFTRWCMAWNFKLNLLVCLNSLTEWSWHQQNLPVGFCIGCTPASESIKTAVQTRCGHSAQELVHLNNLT